MVESPWLTPKEAADYCKISLSLFNQIRRKIPIKVGGTKRRPRFHKDELDYWMKNTFKTDSEMELERNKNDEAREKLLKEDSRLGRYSVGIKAPKYKASPLL